MRDLVSPTHAVAVVSIGTLRANWSRTPTFSRLRPLTASSPLALAVAFVAACSPASPKVAVAPHAATSAAPGPKLPPPASPAHWSQHPSRASRMHARIDLGAAGTLFAGDGGERWLESRDGTTAHLAQDLLSESLVAAVPTGAGRGFYFASENGAVFTTAEPLGGATATHPPPRPLRSVTAGKLALVAIASDGTLLRTVDGGASWKPVDLVGAAGTLISVAMSATGEGLALLAPQQLFATGDDGATFVRLDATASGGRRVLADIGARRVVADGGTEVVVEGMTGAAVLRTSPLRLERSTRPPARDAIELAASPEGAVAAFAIAVDHGRAAMAGDRYLEAISDPDDSSRWRVSIAPFGSPLVPKSISETNGCSHLFVGGDAATLYLLCDGEARGARPSSSDGSGPVGGLGRWGGGGGPPSGGEGAELRLFRSDDGGKSWSADGSIGSMGSDFARIWASPDGAVFITGGCKRARSGSCNAENTVVRNPGSKTFARVNAPRGIAALERLAFGPHNTAYALAHTPQGSLVFLASSNGGRDFARGVLPALAGRSLHDPALTSANLVGVDLSVDDKGIVRAVAHHDADWVAFTSNDDTATTFTATRPPFRVAALAFVGRRGFAYDLRGRAHETSDGGATWVGVGAPQLNALSDAAAVIPATGGRASFALSALSGAATSKASLPLVCGAYGCLVSDRATRIGWGADSATGTSTSPGSASSATVKVGATFTCTTTGEWLSLGALESAPSVYEAEPTAAVPWLAIKQDIVKGSVDVVVASIGAKGLETKIVSLLGPSAKDTATAALPQLEGVAALRFTFKREKPVAVKVDPAASATSVTTAPSASPPVPGTPPEPKPAEPALVVADGQKVDVELAWYVAATGRVMHARIAGVGPLDARDVVVGTKEAAARVAVPLLSITQGGIHVRPFGTRNEVPFYFASDAGKVETMRWPDIPTRDPSGAPLGLRTDAIRADGKSVVIGVGPTGVEVVTALATTEPSGSKSWDLRTWSLWPDPGAGHEIPTWDVAYVGARPAIVTTWPGEPTLPATSFATPLRGGSDDPGAPLFAPSQRLLADLPRACIAAALGAPRVVAPYALGTRHAVVIHGEGTDALLATDAAILHGNSAADACATLYEARQLTVVKDAPAYTALVAVDPAGSSTLFRMAPAGAEIGARAMSCTAAMAPLPKALETTEGFVAPEP